MDPCYKPPKEVRLEKRTPPASVSYPGASLTTFTKAYPLSQKGSMNRKFKVALVEQEELFL